MDKSKPIDVAQLYAPTGTTRQNMIFGKVFYLFFSLRDRPLMGWNCKEMNGIQP